MLARLNHPAAYRVHDAYRPLSPKGDPTGTGDLRRRYRAETDIRWRKMRTQLRSVIVAQDMLGLDPNKPTQLGLALQALPSHALILAFQTWLDKTLERVTLENDTAYLDPMILLSYNRAVVRAMRLTKFKTQPPNAADAIGALQQVIVVEMQGINAAVSQRIMRAASDAIVNNQMPKQFLAAALDAVEKIGVIRSRAMVETYVVKAHAVGTLDQFEAVGVRRVGLIPETLPRRIVRTDSTFVHDVRGRAGTGPGSRISRETIPSPSTVGRIRRAQARVEALGEVNVLTAGDEDVCPFCQALENDSPYTIDQARSLVPAHPWCRCTFVPTADARFAESGNFFE